MTQCLNKRRHNNIHKFGVPPNTFVCFGGTLFLSVPIRSLANPHSKLSTRGRR